MRRSSSSPRFGDPNVEGLRLRGSFSAVSKPNFARKYAVESFRGDLHHVLLCTALGKTYHKWLDEAMERLGLDRFLEED